jgi:hypothetical protein
MIRLEISIHIDGSTSLPLRERHPVWREIDSRLRTGRAKNGETPGKGRFVIDSSETFRNLQFSHLPAHSDEFVVSVLQFEIN